MGLLSYRKPQWKDQVNKQAEKTARLSDRVAATPLSKLSVPTRLSPPTSLYHLLATDLKALWTSPSEMMHCAGGVIIEDNILLEHSIKVDPTERSWLLYFLSVVARLVLYTESLRAFMGVWHHPGPPCLRLLPGCVYQRKGGRQREKSFLSLRVAC